MFSISNSSVRPTVTDTLNYPTNNEVSLLISASTSTLNSSISQSESPACVTHRIAVLAAGLTESAMFDTDSLRHRRSGGTSEPPGKLRRLL